MNEQDLRERIATLETEIKQVETQANAEIYLRIGKKQAYEELLSLLQLPEQK